MKHLFVSYEIARQLKEKGFDEPCIACYNRYYEESSLVRYELYPLVNWHKVEGINPSDVKSTVCAPLCQQVIDWFREKQNLVISILPYKDHAADVNDPVVWKWHVGYKGCHRSDTQEEYYEALNKAIEEALKLI